jgi:hypothetical protein
VASKTVLLLIADRVRPAGPVTVPNADVVLISAPPLMFNDAWAPSTRVAKM